ncbi:hypothetical protein CYLTODRAFT_460453 [Cylindrobasidium torrendii FP15055 ss-10]|uniref:Uncharacterized protein n=1 Tax=Cylindrobasidium torrendii FP15055 ss-10 TaxID=1314674 RepID=A0A0D7ARC1_9AGAR|nr:hypothetical protein CYLTODRAFT_460453 [Cylindrobasidium torrendii FP15055 ss-10]
MSLHRHASSSPKTPPTDPPNPPPPSPPPCSLGSNGTDTLAYVHVKIVRTAWS